MAIKVTLLTHTPNPEQTVAMAAKLCYSPSGIEDIREGLTSVISVKIPDPQFEGQTKGKLGTSEATSAVATVLSEKFTEVSEYISQHYQEDLSVAELAEKFHMSYSYFAAIFKEYYGQTCKEMILTVRLQKAEDLL